MQTQTPPGHVHMDAPYVHIWFALHAVPGVGAAAWLVTAGTV